MPTVTMTISQQTQGGFTCAPHTEDRTQQHDSKYTFVMEELKKAIHNQQRERCSCTKTAEKWIQMPLEYSSYI